MADYKSMYCNLVDKVDTAINLLQEGLLEAEEKYIASEETVVKLFSENQEKYREDE